ncbi:MAG: TetR/AcrR family transcriptional regulator [Sphingomonadaceae bacterium]
MATKADQGRAADHRRGADDRRNRVAPARKGPAPRRYDPAETRTRVIEAAYQLFSTLGYKDTGTADIARVADVSEGSIFYHFGSKRALLAELGRLHGEKMVAAMQGGDSLATLDPADVITRCFAFCADNTTWEAMAGGSECESSYKDKQYDPEAAPFFLAAREVTQAWVEDHIRAWNAAHGIEGVDPAIAASLTFTAVGDALHLAFQPGVSEEHRAHILAQTIRFVKGACMG